MLSTLWAEATSCCDPARTMNRSPFRLRLAPNVLITSCMLWLDPQSRWPVGCARLPTAEHHTVLSKPVRLKGSSDFEWISAILTLRFCSVKGFVHKDSGRRNPDSKPGFSDWILSFPLETTNECESANQEKGPASLARDAPAEFRGQSSGDTILVRREPCQVLVFSGCNSHPATGSLQPVAIGAAVEPFVPPSAAPSRPVNSGLGDLVLIATCLYSGVW